MGTYPFGWTVTLNQATASTPTGCYHQHIYNYKYTYGTVGSASDSTANLLVFNWFTIGIPDLACDWNVLRDTIPGTAMTVDVEQTTWSNGDWDLKACGYWTTYSWTGTNGNVVFNILSNDSLFTYSMVGLANMVILYFAF